MRCAEAISAIRQTGHSEEIHSPDECSRMVVRRRCPVSLSISVFWIVAISERRAPAMHRSSETIGNMLAKTQVELTNPENSLTRASHQTLLLPSGDARQK